MFDVHALAARGRTEPYARAYLGGTFDCLHRGHLALFAATRRVARELVVSVNTDEFAARYKRRPLMPLADRLAVLGSCKLVDRVVVNVGDEDSSVAIEIARPDCVVHGSDWQGDALLEQMGLTREWLQTRAIDVVILPYTPWTSTTQLLEAYDLRASA
jgi:glycerol-3-phosphate cytidylyltransferase